MPSPDPGAENGHDEFVVENEFASATLALDTSANGPRLLILDRRNGRRVYLDPLEVVSLTWATHEDLRPFLDPSATGWIHVPF